MGSAHTPSTAAHDGTATDVRPDAPSVERPREERVQRDLAQWKRFLHAEDRRCDEFRFAAALVTIGLHRASDLDAACRLLDTELRPTDHIAVLCADELSVLLSPVDSIQHAQKIVRRLDTAFHGAAIDAHMGWAMRHEGHGLFHAAARADAAMLTAKGHGNLAFDLSKR
jgi:hypothetical protein